MPDHVHLLLTPNTKTIAQTMNLIKGGFSRRIGSKFPVWQRGFADHLILDRDHFESRRIYIHQNPVRANLVRCRTLSLLLRLSPRNPSDRTIRGDATLRHAFTHAVEPQKFRISPPPRKGTRLRVPRAIAPKAFPLCRRPE